MRVTPKKINLILFLIHFGLTLSQLASFCLRSQPVSTSEFCVYFEHAATGRKVKTFGIFNCKLKSVNIFDIRNQKWNINFWSYLRQHCLAISPKKHDEFIVASTIWRTIRNSEFCDEQSFQRIPRWEGKKWTFIFGEQSEKSELFSWYKLIWPCCRFAFYLKLGT